MKKIIAVAITCALYQSVWGQIDEQRKTSVSNLAQVSDAQIELKTRDNGTTALVFIPGTRDGLTTLTHADGRITSVYYRRGEKTYPVDKVWTTTSMWMRNEGKMRWERYHFGYSVINNGTTVPVEVLQSVGANNNVLPDSPPMDANYYPR